jgi:hypothetical protein
LLLVARSSWLALLVSLGLALMLGSGCEKSPAQANPPNNPPKHCASSNDCPNGQFCNSQGACVAGCRSDTECPNGGVCHPDGTCGTRPQCVLDTDCQAGFNCVAGACACTTDYSCWVSTSGQPVDTSKICVNGACQASTACNTDNDCSDGRYCGPAGVCTSPCLQNSDCGGTTQTGGALTCSNGRCTQPCVADSTQSGVGGCKDGQICQNGLCQPAQCTTLADCGDPTLLCTDANHGRCQSFTVCDPTIADVCGPESECRTYTLSECPPGFDCSQSVCIAETPCLVDAQCQANQVCQFGGCVDSPTCNSTADCNLQQDCIGGHCVTHVCRGDQDCSNGSICSGGQCVAPDPGGDIVTVKLLTPPSTLEVGQTRQLLAVALTASGASKPVAAFDWSVTPNTVASISSSGLLTALSPGGASVTVGFSHSDGTHATPDSATFQVVAAVTSGGRVVVVDSATGVAISGALVRVCSSRDANGNCLDSQDLTTASDGTAAFNVPDAGSFDVSASDPAQDASGAAVHDVVHLLGIHSTDLLVPLPGNQADRSAGFTATIDFAHVQTTGATNFGLAGSTIADLASFKLQDLLGQQPWISQVSLPQNPFPGIPGLPQLPQTDGGSFPLALTGAVTLDFTNVAGTGINVDVKDTVYALGAPGVRCGWAFAGKINPQLVLSSVAQGGNGTGALGAVLPFFGAFDHGLVVAINEPLKDDVLDQEDLDGDGVCEDTNRCATGGETIADYTHFPSVIFRPAQPQSLRADVAAPPSPQNTAQTLLIAGAQIPGAGLLPLGLISAPGDGSSTTVNMAPLYGGLDATQYALLALAQGPVGGQVVPTDGGAPTGGGNVTDAPLSVQILRSSELPTQVTLANPFVPYFSNAHYDPVGRTFTPGDSWSDIAAATGLLRLALVGSKQRVFVYASPSALASGSTLFVPLPPGNPTYDPAADPAVLAAAAALSMPVNDTLDELVSLPGDTLLDVSNLTTGFSRAPLQ